MADPETYKEGAAAAANGACVDKLPFQARARRLRKVVGSGVGDAFHPVFTVVGIPVNTDNSEHRMVIWPPRLPPSRT